MKRLILSFSALLCSLTNFAADSSVKMNTNQAAPLTAVAEIYNNDADSVAIIFKSETHKFVYGRSYKQKFPIIGLKANMHYSVEVKLYSDNKILEELPVQYIDTPCLPDNPALMPKIEVSISNEKKMEEGYTLFNPRRDAPRTNTLDDSFNQAYGMLMAINHKGETVWYYTTGSRISDFDILSNGNISYLTQDNTLVEIDWFGNIINSWYAAKRPQKNATTAIPVNMETMHHDVTQLPNGNFVTLGTEWKELDNYWTNDTSMVKSRQKVMGDIVYEFDKQGNIVWEWHAFDYLNPYVAGHETFHSYWQRRGFPDVRADWSHANAVVYDKSSDALLVNFRHLSLILKIDRKSKNIIWAFGNETEILDDKSLFINLNTGSFPWHQHSPEITPKGTLLFFNNDNYKAYLPNRPERVQDSYSYANEYYIDEQNLIANEIWKSSYKHDKYIVSVAMGDVDYLKNSGNILVSYGQLLDQSYLPKMKSWEDRKGTWTMMREYSHSNPTEILWETRLKKLNKRTNINWNIFGAERFIFK